VAERKSKPRKKRPTTKVAKPRPASPSKPAKRKPGAPPLMRGVAPITWVKVASPAGIPSGTPVRVLSNNAILQTDMPGTVGLGRQIFRLADAGTIWQADLPLDEQRPLSNPYRVVLSRRQAAAARAAPGRAAPSRPARPRGK